MALKIRLRRMGRKKAPHYRIVIAESTMPRDGRFVATIGHYNPTTQPEILKVDREKAAAWMAKGAVPTDTVRSLLRKAGVNQPESTLDTVTAAVSNAAATAGKAVKGAAAKVADVASSAAAAVASVASDAASTVADAAASVAETVKDAAETVVEKVTGGDEAAAEAPAAEAEATEVNSQITDDAAEAPVAEAEDTAVNSQITDS